MANKLDVGDKISIRASSLNERTGVIIEILDSQNYIVKNNGGFKWSIRDNMIIKKITNTDIEIKCEDCGTTKNVRETICPYQEDVNDIIKEITICDKCYIERVYDI